MTATVYLTFKCKTLENDAVMVVVCYVANILLQRKMLISFLLTYYYLRCKMLSIEGNILTGVRVICKPNFENSKTGEHTIKQPYLLSSKNRLRKTGGGRRHMEGNYMPTKNDFNIKQGDKTFGVIDGDVLRIIKTSDEHFVRKYKGFGISPSTLDKAEADNCHLLEFTTPKNKTYIFPIADFRRGAIPDDLGFGRQLFMAERWMQWYSDKYAEACNPSPKQMELFVC